jgi:hypothetical protein
MGNSHRASAVLPCMKRLFRWLRAILADEQCGALRRITRHSYAYCKRHAEHPGPHVTRGGERW